MSAYAAGYATREVMGRVFPLSSWSRSAATKLPTPPAPLIGKHDQTWSDDCEQTGIVWHAREAEVLALKPDCVLYMPHVCNYDEICRLLEAGVNIVTTRMELQNPAALDTALCARIEEACRRGNSSIHATGCSPGFISARSMSATHPVCPTLCCCPTTVWCPRCALLRGWT